MISTLFLLSLLSPAVRAQNLVFTQDFNTNGRICLSGNCLSPEDVNFVSNQRTASNPVSLRSFSNWTQFIAAENPATNDYQLKRMVGSMTSPIFPFTIQQRNIWSFAGCYALNGTALFMSRSHSNLTLPRCYQAALRSGDTFFSLQNFGQCTSGSTLPSNVGIQPATNCLFACTLDASQISRSNYECGSSMSAAVYSINSVQTSFMSNTITNGSQVRLLNTTTGSPVQFRAALGFPPSAMLANTFGYTSENAAYGIGEYEVTVSSNLGGFSNAFRQLTQWNYWHSNGGYNPGDGQYIGTFNTTISTGAVLRGEWLQLRMPSAISLDSYGMRPRDDMADLRSPRNMIILGSNTGSNWMVLDNRTNIKFLSWEPQRFVVNSTVAYSYYRVVVQRVGNYDSYAAMNSVQIGWELYGFASGTEDTFFLEPSNEAPGAIRIHSAKYLGYYARSQNGTIQMHRDFNSDSAFKNDSAFYPTRGLGGFNLPIV